MNKTRSPRRIALGIGGPHFLDAPVLWAFFVALSAATTLFALRAGSLTVAPWAVFTVISNLVPLLLLRGLGTLLRVRSWRRPHPFVAVGSYLGATVLRMLAGVPAMVALGIAEPPGIPPLANRTLAAGLFVAAVSAAASFMTWRTYDHRRTLAQLTQTQAELSDAAQTTAAQIEAARQSVLEEVRQGLQPSLEEIRSRLAAAPGDERTKADIVGALTRVVADVVRPMSHALAAAEPSTAAPVPAPALAGLGALIRARIRMSEAIRPGWITLIVVAMLVNGLPLWGADPVFFSVVTALAAITFAALWAVRRWWPAALAVLPFGTALAALAGVYLVIFVSPHLVLARLDPRWAPATGLAASVVARVLPALIVTVVAMLDHQQTALEEAVRRSNEELRLQGAVLRRELWSIRRHMALVLHGPVQSVLTSSALILSIRPPTESTLREIEARIDEAVAYVETGYVPSRAIDAGLAEISGLWRDTASVTTELSDAASALCEADSALSTCVAEIVREAVGNAVRHGHATRIEVSVEVAGERLLRVRVVDDGAGLPPEVAPGLGTKLLDDVTLHWRHAPRSTGTELVALVA